MNTEISQKENLLYRHWPSALLEHPCRRSLRSLLCVTDHCLPGENQHWVSPAYLGQILSGEATNCEPAKTCEVRWFSLNELPSNLTMTARNAIEAYASVFRLSEHAI